MMNHRRECFHNLAKHLVHNVEMTRMCFCAPYEGLWNTTSKACTRVHVQHDGKENDTQKGMPPRTH